MQKKLTAASFLLVGGEAIPLITLGADELAKARGAITANISRGMSEYYSHHPECLHRLLEGGHCDGLSVLP